jgi:hypothetical protein
VAVPSLSLLMSASLRLIRSASASSMSAIVLPSSKAHSKLTIASRVRARKVGRSQGWFGTPFQKVCIPYLETFMIMGLCLTAGQVHVFQQ